MHSLGKILPARFVLAVLLLGAAVLPAAGQRVTPTPPIFVPRPIGVIPEPTPTPEYKGKVEEEKKPIPREYWIAGGIAGAVLLLLLIIGAVRAYLSSNIFDRQYRFRLTGEAAMRLGGQKSGGHLAQVRFGPAAAGSSKAKDA